MTIKNLAGIIRAHGATRTHYPALEAGDSSRSFGELDARSSQVANAMLAVGVGAGDRVASIDKNSIEYFELTFGLAKIGAVNVAVNWRLAPEEMRQIIDDSQAEVVVVASEFAAHLEVIEARLPRVRHVVVIGEHERWTPYEPWIDEQSSIDPGYDPVGDDVTFQLYTSGTTGLPKGVMITTDNFFSNIEGLAAKWKLTSDSVSLAMMPTFHIAGAGWAMVSLYFGCRTVVMREVDPGEVIRLIGERRVTTAFMVPAVIQFVLGTPGVEAADFSSLQSVLYGAAPISEAVLRQGIERFDCAFTQIYGLTETSGAISQLDSADHDPEARPELLRSAGRPYPWMDLRIVDQTTGLDVPTGTVGEIWVRSPAVMLGYWNNEAGTAEAVDDDGWFRTGDAGYLRDGYLYLHDRVKDMIVSGGENVYPAEVENALMKHEDVADVAVIGVPDERWGEAVKALVVLAPGATVTPDELIDFARGHLAGFKLPKSVDVTDLLPRNPSGKLLKRELRAPYWEGLERQIG